ncbi:MAG: tetratricopeptide repeat protein [Alphaproteobacteria bacterium]
MTDKKTGSKQSLSNALKLHQGGQLGAAQAAYEAVLAADPEHADAENLLGVLLAQTDRLTDAMARFARATELDPKNALYWFNRGEGARRMERTDDAIEWYRKALRFQPDYEDAFSNLVALLAQSDRHDEFLQLVRAKRDASPKITEHLIQIGQELLARRATDTAATLFEILATRHPDNRIVARNLGAALLRQGKLDAAHAHLRTLTEAHPEWPDALHLLGLCFNELDQTDLAIEALSLARKLAPSRVDTALALIQVHERRRDPEAAHAVIDDALEVNPDEPRMLARLAEHHERVSRLDEAQAAAERALALNPLEPMAHTVLVQTAARSKDYELARSRVHTSEDIVRDSPAELRFSYTAGRICETTGEYEEAFRFYTRANQLLRNLTRAQRMNSQDHLSRLQKSRKAFEAADLSTAAPSMTRETPDQDANALPPIFIVGFPRSGTTMLERLIGNSPNVVISDELPTMRNAVNRFHEITGSSFLTPAALEQLTEDDLRQLRSDYRDSVARLIPRALEPGMVLVNKDPMSTVNLPLIARMFPDSPLLVLLRDPRDVCLSCFSTEFVVNRTTHLLSDLTDTVALYEAVMGLWLAFKPALRHRTMTVHYEELSADVDGHLPGILNFCGLEPASGSLDGNVPAAQAGDWVNTASYNTVIEPVHQRAIARWKHFEPFLETTFAPLTPFIEQMGYPAHSK